LLSTDDKIAIQELVATASLRVDDHDAAGFAATFTEDGVFERGDATVQGRAAITTFMEEHIAAGGEDDAAHLNVNFVIEGGGDRATSTSRVVKLKTAPEAEIIAVAIYRDSLVRNEEGWRFARRALELLYLVGA
jgi:uncharacterized protein (TIGR02246 family)